MFKKILVALDGSERAESTLPLVEQLARCLQAELILLRVYTTDFGQVDPYGHLPEFYEALQADAKVQMQAYVDAVRQAQLGEDLTVRTLAAEGPAVETILQVAAREGADLIAMCSLCRSRLSRIFRRDPVEGVLHQVDWPLLFIRSEKEHAALEGQTLVG